MALTFSKISAAFMVIAALLHLIAVIPAEFSDQSMTEALLALPALLAAWLMWKSNRWVAGLLVIGLVFATWAAFGHLGHSTIPDTII